MRAVTLQARDQVSYALLSAPLLVSWVVVDGDGHRKEAETQPQEGLPAKPKRLMFRSMYLSHLDGGILEGILFSKIEGSCAMSNDVNDFGNVREGKDQTKSSGRGEHSKSRDTRHL
jgi:hypothetical protein